MWKKHLKSRYNEENPDEDINMKEDENSVQIPTESSIARGQPSQTGGLSSASDDPYSVASIDQFTRSLEPEQYPSSPLTPPSETSSLNSPGERRDSNDSQDVGSNNSNSRPRRLGKDEKLARKEDITRFISVDDIINLPMDVFNDRLETAGTTQGMSEKQRTIARDIRRRGKNKNAAQNCRKRANTRLGELKEKVEKMNKEKKKLQQFLKTLKEYNSMEQELKDRWDDFIARYGYENRHYRYDTYDTARISVEDKPRPSLDDPYPFEIHPKSPSPEMSRYSYPVRPEPVWPTDSYQAYPYPHFVTRVPGGAFLSQVPPSAELIRCPYGPPYPPPNHDVSLFPLRYHLDTKIKQEEIEDLSKG